MKKSTNPRFAQQPRNVVIQRVDEVIPYIIVHTILGFCEFSIKIAALKWSEDDRPVGICVLNYGTSAGSAGVQDRPCLSYYCGDDSLVQEPVFVPRSANAPEGDGWVIALVEKVKENRSEVVILDTYQRVQKAGRYCAITVPCQGADPRELGGDQDPAG